MLDAGAHAIKLFPAEAASPAVLKSIRAVLPLQTIVIPVGGITPDKLSAYWKAGARGFGLGSALYKAGMSVGEVSDNAMRFRESMAELVSA